MLFILLGLSKLGNSPAPKEDVPEVAPTEESVQADDAALKADQMPMDNPQGNTTVVMKTNKGDITIELFTRDMPITAGNFLKLAKENFYDGVKFHRVIDGFMIQAGDPNSKDDTKMSMWGTGGPGYAIADEFVDGYSNVRGTIAMANAGPNSGGSQFFINLVDNTNLDWNKPPEMSKHPVFGKITSGMDIVDAIGKTPTGPRDVPVDPVIIQDIEVR